MQIKTNKIPTIKIENLSFSYSHKTKHNTLSDVNLCIQDKEFWGIIGPNGGGKSTLIKLILGLLTPNTGNIQIFGQSPRRSAKNIGYVPQFGTFQKNFPIDVFNTVLMGCLTHSSIWGTYTKKNKTQTWLILKKLEIDHLAEKPIYEISGGQLQKVLIARALVTEPQLLVLDEPTSHVDTHSEEDLFSMLKSLQKKMGIIVVSHDLGFISHYVDHVACINQTLITDITENLTAKKLEELYGGHLKTISHKHTH